MSSPNGRGRGTSQLAVCRGSRCEDEIGQLEWLCFAISVFFHPGGLLGGVTALFCLLCIIIAFESEDMALVSRGAKGHAYFSNNFRFYSSDFCVIGAWRGTRL